MEAEADRRGFFKAAKQAFVGDGLQYNWTIQQRHFPTFTPILDFVHAVCYIYHAAIGGDPSPEAWQRYCHWAQLLWSGASQKLLEEMEAWQAQIGLPGVNDNDSSPQQLLADAIRYVTNQQSRMKYADYRRNGLPTTSAYIESTIKQVNQRMKGTEKFWDQRTEPLLQLVAGRLTETNRLDRFWHNRRNRLQYMRCYQSAV